MVICVLRADSGAEERPAAGLQSLGARVPTGLRSGFSPLGTLARPEAHPEAPGSAPNAICSHYNPICTAPYARPQGNRGSGSGARLCVCHTGASCGSRPGDPQHAPRGSLQPQPQPCLPLHPASDALWGPLHMHMGPREVHAISTSHVYAQQAPADSARKHSTPACATHSCAPAAAAAQRRHRALPANAKSLSSVSNAKNRAAVTKCYGKVTASTVSSILAADARRLHDPGQPVAVGPRRRQRQQPVRLLLMHLTGRGQLGLLTWQFGRLFVFFLGGGRASRLSPASAPRRAGPAPPVGMAVGQCKCECVRRISTGAAPAPWLRAARQHGPMLCAAAHFGKCHTII